uniref:Uncharacterized protein n=1 Tax=Magallana gigas TaxID=29159 RepID=A0A8W8NVW4_MAGGI
MEYGVLFTRHHFLDSRYAEADLCEVEVYGCPITGYYRSNCSVSCPDVNCRYCHIETGTCQGCKPGYQGQRCESACQHGFFGQDCTERCNDRCQVLANATSSQSLQQNLINGESVATAVILLVAIVVLILYKRSRSKKLEIRHLQDNMADQSNHQTEL